MCEERRTSCLIGGVHTPPIEPPPRKENSARESAIQRWTSEAPKRGRRQRRLANSRGSRVFPRNNNEKKKKSARCGLGHTALAPEPRVIGRGLPSGDVTRSGGGARTAAQPMARGVPKGGALVACGSPSTSQKSCRRGCCRRRRRSTDGGGSNLAAAIFSPGERGRDSP